MSANRPRILVSESSDFATEAEESLRQVGELVLADLDRPELLSAVRGADVLWVRLRHRIDAEVMQAARDLRFIVSPTTGLNHIDLTEATRREIEVISLYRETDFLQNVRATAEHTLALMLNLLRRLPMAVAHVQGGGWNRDLFRGRELYGKTVGIIGYGRLGRIVGRYLRALDVRVLIADPNINADSLEPGICMVPFNQLLQQSDIVSLHVDLSDRTTKFFGRQQFGLMRRGAYFVNTARGELVDESALLEALDTGWLSGAAVDVLCAESSEGMGTHPLVLYGVMNDNLLITPHLGGCTFESLAKSETFLAKKLSAYLLSGSSAKRQKTERPHV